RPCRHSGHLYSAFKLPQVAARTGVAAGQPVPWAVTGTPPPCQVTALLMGATGVDSSRISTLSRATRLMESKTMQTGISHPEHAPGPMVCEWFIRRLNTKYSTPPTSVVASSCCTASSILVATLFGLVGLWM